MAAHHRQADTSIRSKFCRFFRIIGLISTENKQCRETICRYDDDYVMRLMSERHSAFLTSDDKGAIGNEIAMMQFVYQRASDVFNPCLSELFDKEQTVEQILETFQMLLAVSPNASHVAPKVLSELIIRDFPQWMCLEWLEGLLLETDHIAEGISWEVARHLKCKDVEALNKFRSHLAYEYSYTETIDDEYIFIIFRRRVGTCPELSNEYLEYIRRQVREKLRHTQDIKRLVLLVATAFMAGHGREAVSIQSTFDQYLEGETNNISPETILTMACSLDEALLPTLRHLPVANLAKKSVSYLVGNLEPLTDEVETTTKNYWRLRGLHSLDHDNAKQAAYAYQQSSDYAKFEPVTPKAWTKEDFDNAYQSMNH